MDDDWRVLMTDEVAYAIRHDQLRHHRQLKANAGRKLRHVSEWDMGGSYQENAVRAMEDTYEDDA